MDNLIKERTASFSGHRNIPPDDAAAVAENLKKAVSELTMRGITRFCAGGAQGFDMLASLVVLENPALSLTLILPFKEQTNRWGGKEIGFYEHILDRADQVIYTAEHYSRGCYHLRNRRLVDESCVLLCYYTGCTGGTSYTVSYAKKKKLK